MTTIPIPMPLRVVLESSFGEFASTENVPSNTSDYATSATPPAAVKPRANRYATTICT